MPLSPGIRIGSYEVLSSLGAGGMGEVYRARDTKLNRDVALKILPAVFTSDPDRLARFKREAQVLASLNHANIGHIYGFEDSSAAHALVLELVEGPTLADRIARGPLPLREAIGIAKQIADALDTAHEQGIVHRDLKPANVKVREDGTVKVLDFGLAKALAPDPASSDAMNSPTMTARQTEMGMILGTAAYMSPEQAKGKPADRRADVWAFGVVLNEMLTGRQVFTGETAPEVMASVMKEDPDWSLLPPALPASIERLLRRTLEKDPKKRLSSMSDVRLELNEAESAPVSSRPSRGSARPWIGFGAAAIAGAILTALVFLFVVPGLGSSPAREPMRVSVIGPSGVTPQFDAAESAISPDGQTLVFTTVDPKGTTMLWVRPLASLEAHPLAGTETGHLPFWSPDSREIGFFSDTKLKKITLAGGTIDVLCDAKDGRGGSWGSQNVIVFAPVNSGSLQMVSANGGDPKPVTTLDTPRGETAHRFPSFLPDGRHFLFVTLPMHNQKFDVFVGATDGTRSKMLLSAEGAAVYAEPGYLLFSRQDKLVAQRFDAASQQLSGEALAVSDAASSTGGLFSAGPSVSASRTGTLAYLGDRLPNTTLSWFDRAGKNIGTLAAPDGRYQEIVFSGDGKRAAIVRNETQSKSDIWIADVGGGTTRFTATPGLNIDAVWAPDGSRLLFSSDRAGPRDFLIKPASGATPEEPFYASKVLFKDARAWSPDGKSIVYEQLDPETNRDLYLLPADGRGTPAVYLRTPFNEEMPAVSPDGKWLAYASDESGRFELYVDSFPTPRRRYRVTDQSLVVPVSGSSLAWRKDGKELAFVGADARSVLVADVATGNEFHASTPRTLMTLPKDTVSVGFMPDLQRVLAAVPVSDNNASTLTLIFNWLGALGKR